MTEEDNTGFWKYSDGDIIDELSRHSGVAITLSHQSSLNGIICEALKRILLKLQGEEE